MGRQRKIRTAWRGDFAIQRRDAGRDLQAAVGHVEKDSVPGRDNALAADGFPFPAPPVAEHPGLLQPKRRDLQQGDQEEGVLCLARLLREIATMSRRLYGTS